MQTAVVVTNEERIIAKARKGLKMVHEGEEKTIEGWLLYGEALLELRYKPDGSLRSNNEFHERMASCQLGITEHPHDRAAAMWAAEKPQEFWATKKAHPRVRTVRGLHARWMNPEPAKAEPATPPEKEMLRKLKVLAEQGATEGERAAAQKRLDRYMSDFKIKPESLDEPCSSVGLSRRDMKVQIAKTLLSNADKKLALNYIMFFIDMAYESDEDIERKLNEIKEKF